MSNVDLKDIRLAGHSYRVTMQKVPQILSQTTGNILKSHVFSNQNATKTAHIKIEKY